jgi:hypothetical protein
VWLCDRNDRMIVYHNGDYISWGHQALLDSLTFVLCQGRHFSNLYWQEVKAK